jgi:hypothetical protein
MSNYLIYGTGCIDTNFLGLSLIQLNHNDNDPFLTIPFHPFRPLQLKLFIPHKEHIDFLKHGNRIEFKQIKRPKIMLSSSRSFPYSTRVQLKAG